MPYYKHRPVVVIPVDQKDRFDILLKKHGYAFDLEPVYKANDKKAKPTIIYYVVETDMDNGMLAAIKLVLQQLKKEGKMAGKTIRVVLDNKMRGRKKDKNGKVRKIRRIDDVLLDKKIGESKIARTKRRG